MNLKRDTNTKLAVIDEEGERLCQIQCYDSESKSIDSIEIKGQTSPNLQGWYSKNGRELVENTALGYPIVGASYFWVTVFDFRMGKTGQPYLRSGTGGKYIRFALTQDDNKTDVRIKLDKEGKRSIEVEIDLEVKDVDIQFDEG